MLHCNNFTRQKKTNLHDSCVSHNNKLFFHYSSKINSWYLFNGNITQKKKEKRFSAVIKKVKANEFSFYLFFFIIAMIFVQEILLGIPYNILRLPSKYRIVVTHSFIITLFRPS